MIYILIGMQNPVEALPFPMLLKSQLSVMTWTLFSSLNSFKRYEPVEQYTNTNLRITSLH